MSMKVGLHIVPSLSLYCKCPVCGGNAADVDDHAPDCYRGREGQLKLMMELMERVGGLWSYDCATGRCFCNGVPVDGELMHNAVMLHRRVEAGEVRIDEIDGQACVVELVPTGMKLDG